MTDYNASRRFIKARRSDLVGLLPGRSQQIRGVFLHSTRGGTKNNDDGPGTENWANHPQNQGAFWDMLIFGSGQQVKSTYWERDEQPLWCAGGGGPGSGTWSAQANYIHCEISQGTIDSPFTPASIESAAQFVAEQARIYGFPIQRIPYLTQKGAAPYGIADHANSANGDYYGKSDVGPLFPWSQFLARIDAINAPEQTEELQMTEEQIRTIVRNELALNEVSATNRLNAAIQTRMAITRIANDPDLAIVEQAAAALRGVGFRL